MKPQLVCYALGATLAILSGCSSREVTPKVLVPPLVELGVYNTVGVVLFSSNARENLDELATQQFMQRVQAAQPGVRMLELGSERRVLSAISHHELDFEAIRAIGEKWGVAAVFVGSLELTAARPDLELTTIVKSVSVHADVEAFLQARLVETESGATVWTRSARGKAPVAHLHATSRGPIDLGATDPERVYGKLVGGLVNRLTVDFYWH